MGPAWLCTECATANILLILPTHKAEYGADEQINCNEHYKRPSQGNSLQFVTLGKPSTVQLRLEG